MWLIPVRGGTAFIEARPHVHGDEEIRVFLELERRPQRQHGTQAAITKPPAVRFERREVERERARRVQGIRQVDIPLAPCTPAEEQQLAAVEIGGRDRQRDAEVLEAGRGDDPGDRGSQCGRGEQAAGEQAHEQGERIEWRDVLAPDPHRAAPHLIERHAGAEGGAHDRTHRCGNDVTGQQIGLLQCPEGSRMRERLRTATRQHKYDFTHPGLVRNGVPSRVSRAAWRHDRSAASRRESRERSDRLPSAGRSRRARRR